jgi:hypothetical protein
MKAPFCRQEFSHSLGRIRPSNYRRRSAISGHLGETLRYTSSPNFRSAIMIRLNSSICALTVFLLASSPSIRSAELAKYDAGSFAGPYSESARVGDLLFLAGQMAR